MMDYILFTDEGFSLIRTPVNSGWSSWIVHEICPNRETLAPFTHCYRKECKRCNTEIPDHIHFMENAQLGNVHQHTGYAGMTETLHEDSGWVLKRSAVHAADEYWLSHKCGTARYEVLRFGKFLERECGFCESAPPEGLRGLYLMMVYL